MKGQTSLSHLRHPRTAFLKQLKRTIQLYETSKVQERDACRDELSRLVEAVSDVIEGLEHEYNHNSLKMLGFSLTPSTMSTVWGFLISLIVAFVSRNL